MWYGGACRIFVEVLRKGNYLENTHVDESITLK
jgi:hypothetical protein